MSAPKFLKVNSDEAGMRLDKFIFKNFTNITYSVIQKKIRTGLFKVNCLKKNSSYKLNYLDKVYYSNSLVVANYKEKNVVVLGVPTNNFKQEPGSNKEIKDFCETNFNISFPMTEKIDVIGNNAHPFFIWAKENHGKSAIPKWNFHKIIIGKDGKVADTFSSITKPSSQKFIKLIEKEIKN